ncbi:metal-dependent hydrolase [bacterium]|nr:metal-dependent hydrolase [bacterium]
MPGYKTHLVGGLVSFVVALTVLYKLTGMHVSFLAALGWFFWCILGALFPDIDVKSKGQGFMYPIILFALLFLLYKNKIIAFTVLSIASLLPLVVNHRGLFHSPIFLIGLAVVSALYASKFFVTTDFYMMQIAFFSLGALSHILLDRYTSAH